MLPIKKYILSYGCKNSKKFVTVYFCKIIRNGFSAFDFLYYTFSHLNQKRTPAEWNFNRHHFWMLSRFTKNAHTRSKSQSSLWGLKIDAAKTEWIRWMCRQDTKRFIYTLERNKLKGGEISVPPGHLVLWRNGSKY